MHITEEEQRPRRRVENRTEPIILSPCGFVYDVAAAGHVRTGRVASRRTTLGPQDLIATRDTIRADCMKMRGYNLVEYQ